jgi:hydrogenase nickel incorporation protein HypA/HybF
MHELSIAVSMVGRILEECEKRGDPRVEAVYLRLGVLAGVDKDAVAFCYEIACEGTCLVGSRLVIETVPLLIYCEECNMEHTPESIYDIACPQCHGPAQKVLRGRELELAALEIADERCATPD